MVMHLPRPLTCGLQLVDDIVAERQNGVNAAAFTGIHPEWRTRVKSYDDHAGAPHLVPKWQAIDLMKGSLLNLYLSPSDGSVQGEVLRTMRDHDLDMCPACGEAGHPNTLDHYLPKGTYPHFCVTPLNLFPMCDACQSKKGTKTGSPGTPRFFIHPYFDVFVAQQVLRLEVVPPYDKPTFQLLVCPTLAAEEAALVRSHVRELAIEERYAHFFRHQHRRLLRLVGGMRRSGQDVKENLINFKANASYSSENSWEHIFYSAVVEDVDLLDYLVNAELPEYL